MMSMQKTIQERNHSVDELEEKLRAANWENQRMKERTTTLTKEVELLTEQKGSLEGRLELLSSGMYNKNKARESFLAVAAEASNFGTRNYLALLVATRPFLLR